MRKKSTEMNSQNTNILIKYVKNFEISHLYVTYFHLDEIKKN